MNAYRTIDLHSSAGHPCGWSKAWIRTVGVLCLFQLGVIASVSGQVPCAFTLGNDTTLCPGYDLVLNAPPGTFDLLWSTGDTTSTITVSTAGTYDLTVSSATCTHSASITVLVDSILPVDLGPDLIVCDGQPVVLAHGYPTAAVYWQDLSAGPTFTVTTSGTYWVKVDIDACHGGDIVQIQFVDAPTVVLVGEHVICNAAGVVLTANTGATNIVWQDGSAGTQHTAHAPGPYSVVVEQDGCFANAAMEVSASEPPVLALSGDTLLCVMTPVTLVATGTGDALITWQDGTEGAVLIADHPGIYTVSMTNACGTVTGSAQVNVVPFPVPETIAVCPGEHATLIVDDLVSQIQWGDGSTAATVQLPEGNHAYEAMDGEGCARSGTVTVFGEHSGRDQWVQRVRQC